MSAATRPAHGRKAAVPLRWTCEKLHTNLARMSSARLLQDNEDVSELFRALSSPVRIAIITMLSDGGRCVHELVDAFELPQPLVSQHLKVLRDASLVTRTRRGREAAYVLTDEHVAHIVADARAHAHETMKNDHEDDPDH